MSRWMMAMMMAMSLRLRLRGQARFSKSRCGAISRRPGEIAVAHALHAGQIARLLFDLCDRSEHDRPLIEIRCQGRGIAAGLAVAAEVLDDHGKFGGQLATLILAQYADSRYFQETTAIGATCHNTRSVGAFTELK